jgi:hypothetical protein
MTTLAANLAADDMTLRVNAAVTDPAEFYQIDDEVIWIAAVSTTINGSLSPVRYEDTTLWQIKQRGFSTTAPATHTSGATVTPLLLGAGGGSGGVTVDNTVDPPAEVTTIIALGATIAGAEATLVTTQLLSADVAFDTPGIKTYPGISLFEIPAGAMVVQAGFIRTAVFTQSDTVQNNVYWGLANIADPEDWIDTRSRAAADISQANTLPELFYETPDLALTVPIPLPTGAQVICHMQTNVSGGAATINALIAVPA